MIRGARLGLMLGGLFVSSAGLRAQGSHPAPALAQAPRAVWTWERPSMDLVTSPQVADEALTFLQRKQVGTVYLYADEFEGRNVLVQAPHLYRDLIRNAHARGMRVYALLGSWYLHTERYVLPPNHRAAVTMLRRVLDYNTAAPAEARFDGVNYDIEPHMLEEWEDSTRVRLLRGFLDMTAAMMDAKRRSGQALPIGPAIPFWWDGIPVEWRGVRKAASEHIIDLTDYVTLMDYRNRADGNDSIISHALDEMAYADRVGKRVEIGLDFNPGELAKLTFYGLEESVFEREAAKVEKTLGKRPGFGGFVLHHYDGYRRFVGEPAPTAK